MKKTGYTYVSLVHCLDLNIKSLLVFLVVVIREVYGHLFYYVSPRLFLFIKKHYFYCAGSSFVKLKIGFIFVKSVLSLLNVLIQYMSSISLSTLASKMDFEQRTF